MGKIWSYWAGSVWGQKSGLYGTAVSGTLEFHCLQCKNSGNIHQKCTIFSWPPFTKRDDYQPPTGPFNWSKTHSTGPGGFYYWIDACSTIAGKQIWRSRQISHAWQIATNGRKLTKFFFTFSLHPNTTLGPKTPTTHTHEPPENGLIFRKCDENAWKCALSTFPPLKIP